MLRVLCILCVFFGLGGSVFAQVVQIVTPVCGPVRCTVSIGSGVIIGRQAVGDCRTYYILTVYHISGNRPNQLIRRGVDYKMTVIVQSGKYPAKIHSYNGERLLMLLTIQVPAGVPDMPVMPIADALPCAGDAVAIHGHSFRRNGGYGVRSVVLRTIGPTEFTITSPFEQGESGGPVVLDGKIIGLCEGFYNASKIGFGPSLVSIREFLSLPPVGETTGGRQSGLPVPGGVPMRSGGMSVSVPPPPSDAPRYSPPVHQPGQITPAPELDSDPRTGSVGSETERAESPPGRPPAEVTPASPRKPTEPTEQAERAGQTDSPEAPTVGRKLASAASTSLDVWAMLAGAGIVVGTGGLGGLALLAWRGWRAAKTVSSVRSRYRTFRGNQQKPTQQPGVTPVATQQDPPSWDGRLPPHDVRFVPVPNDYRKASVDFALEQAGRKYPGAIPTVEVIKSMINQHLQATGHGPDTLHS